MKRFKKISIKTIAFLMAVLIAALSLPLNAMAEGLASLFDSLNTPADVSVSKIFELKEARTASTKTFRLEDGSYYLAQYDSNVHYADENGEWQDIDNTLTKDGGEIVTQTEKIKFAKKTTGNGEIFTLHNGNKKLSLSLDNAKKRIYGKITNNENTLPEDATELQKMTALNKISASVLYENILDDVDLEYVINGSDIKENIIVKSMRDCYSYSFTLSLSNLYAELNSLGEVEIKDSDSGEYMYLIPAPIMWDGAGVVSDNVSTSLINIGSGKYTLTVSADSEWMNAEERVYPITIDPPLYTGSSSPVTDIYVTSSGAVNSTTLPVSSSIYSYWKLGTLPTIPTGAYITNAEFSMESSVTQDTDAYVGVYGVESDWDSSLTWSQINAETGHSGKLADNFTDFQRIQYEMWHGHTYGDGEYTWNVTPIVKNWYAGENYGLAFAIVPDTTLLGTPTFHSNEYVVDWERPKLCISYRDMKGLESYWSFTSQSAGFAGTSHINNATGKLVFSIPTLTTTDALMPITPTLVYNSEVLNYSDSGAYQSSPYGYGFTLSICETVKPEIFTDAEGENVTYYVWQDGDGTEHYFVPTEGSTNTYEDEDGLLLTLNVENFNSITITDSNNTVRTFTNKGTYSYLTSIQDKSGNQVLITTSNTGLPTQISLNPNETSEEIVQLTLNYSDYGVLMNISNDTADEMIRFYYDEDIVTSSDFLTNILPGYLSKIEYLASDAVVATAEYTYNGDTELLTSARNNLTGYKLSYTYDSAGRVTQVSESVTSGATTAQGQAVSLTYGTSNTVIRTSGTDDTLNTSDDLLTTYSFDASGRTVTCYTTDLSGKTLYGASNGEYVGEENEKAKNNLKSSVQTSQHSSNYLYNGGFEEWTEAGKPSDWTTSGTVLKSTESYAGRYAARINVPVNKSNYASLTQNVTLKPGKYSMSLYIKTLDTIEARSMSIYVSAEGQDYPSSHYYDTTIPINRCNASNGYVFAELQFTVSSEEIYRLCISVSVSGSVASNETLNIDIDNVMLSKSSSATAFDMVQNGHFESADQWSEFDQSFISIFNTGNGMFHNVAKIEPNLSQTGSLTHVVYEATEEELDGYNADEEQAPVSYTLSGWGKGTAQGFSTESKFELQLWIDYYNGTSETVREICQVTFNKSITDWQFASGGFITNPEQGMVKKITVCIYYDKNPGVGYFDGISLIRDDSATAIYDYNQSGYVSMYKSGENRMLYDYDAENNLRYSVSSSNHIMEYWYDSYSRVSKELSYKLNGEFEDFTDGGISTTGTLKILYVTDYVYDKYGLLVYECMADTSKTNSVINRYSYITDAGSHIFGALESSQNSLVEITYYFYDETNGRLMATISPDGNGIAYTYDSIGNLIQALPASSGIHIGDGATYTPEVGAESVSYTYDSVTKRLTTISTASTSYSFTYDLFGNTTEISAGGNTLAEYTYNENNGKLDTMTYGNGLQVKYFYDSLDRISRIQYNNGEGYVNKYRYEYDGAGRLRLMYDYETYTYTMYDYDPSGRLLKSYNYKSGKILDATSYTYDDKSRVTSMIYSLDYIYDTYVDAYEWTHTYDYDENTDLLSGMNISMSSLTASLSYTYDSLNMLSAKVAEFFDEGDASFYNRTSYEYDEARTARVYKYRSEVGVSSTGTLSATEYNFTYDSNGNITQIKDASGVIQNKYYYDNLGQLIREDNRAKNKTYVWTYDNAGNRTSEKTYAFTTGALGTATSTKNYSYSTSAWGDLMTFDGMNYITYDEIGNPTSIYQDEGSFTHGYELTWEGRQLTAYTYFEDSFYDTPTTYTYNADGIRTGKTTYSGTEYEYALDGSRIISQTWSNYIFVFIYDESGSPIGINYAPVSQDAFDYFASYYFEKNLQGDIIAVYNSAGTKIGTYTYDAWGNVTQTILSTNSTDKFIMNNNPFRYRGYYYDIDTKLYYLQTRYYNPANGRFLNGDSYVSTGQDMIGYNMFAYCNNNPIVYVDPFGNSFLGVLVLSSFIAIPVVILFDTVIGDNLFDDFSYSNELYNSDRKGNAEDGFTEKAIWCEVEGEASQYGETHIEAEIGYDKGTFSSEYFEVEIGIVRGTASVSTDMYEGYGGSIGVESVYADAFLKIPFGEKILKIGVTGNLGSVGATFKVGTTTEFGASLGGGGALSIEWC